MKFYMFIGWNNDDYFTVIDSVDEHMYDVDDKWPDNLEYDSANYQAVRVFEIDVPSLTSDVIEEALIGITQATGTGHRVMSETAAE